MKKIVALMVIIALTFSTVAAASGDIKVILDGKEIAFPDQKPVLENSRTLVPVRFVSEALGANVDWIQTEKKVVITKDNKKIELVVGEKKVKIDSKNIELDVASKSKNDRTLVPLRFISEAFGCQVDWDQNNRMVIIKTSSAQDATKLENTDLQEIADSTPGMVVPEERRGDIVYYSDDGNASLNNTDMYITADEKYICVIMENPTNPTIEAAKKVLQKYYPAGYEKAIGYMMETINSKKTIKTTVIDGRTYNSFFIDNAYCVYIGAVKK